MKKTFTLVIHGGAGTILKKNMTPEKEQQYIKKLTEALQAGYEILNKQGTSVDAVESAVKIMEDSPLFNAAKGAVFSSEGKNEMDASIMYGKTLEAGAITGATTIKNPISAARLIMEKSIHVMMSGEGADQFAKEQGLEIVSPDYFYEEFRYQQWQKVKATDKQYLDHTLTASHPSPSEIEFTTTTGEEKFGTVGAVAVDMYGNVAAATSTGGTANKKYGRIGDSPIIGAGTYANNNSCAVSSTGIGEHFIRGVVAYDIAALMEYKGLSLEAASNMVIHEKLTAMNGKGGIIAVDAKGNYAMPFNTEGMYRGVVKEVGKIEIGIYKT